MKNSLFLNLIRSYNPFVLTAGLMVLFGGILAALILDTTNWWNVALMVLGVLLLLLFLAANLAEVKLAGKKRGTVVRANLTLISLAVFGIVTGLNYIVSRHPVRFDLTSNKIYTLSDQTLDTLKKLTQEVDVTLFTSAKFSSAEVQKAQQLLEEYSKHSTKFHFTVVDGEKNPSETRKFNITQPNTIVFQSGDNRTDVLQKDYTTSVMMGRQFVPKFQGEAAFTSALLKMTDTKHLIFYFTEGHGEKDFANPEADGLTQFKGFLEKENYTVKTLNLLVTGKIPDDASVLASLGPQKPFQATEGKLIGEYLKRGGKLVLCIDPLIKSGLDNLLKDYGVKLGNDMVLDPTMCIPPDQRNVVAQYAGHAIVEKLAENRMISVMPYMRSVQKVDPAIKGVSQTIFLQTTEHGWGITNFKEKKPVYHSGVDTKGPVPLAIACEVALPDNPTQKTRLVVYGGSVFLTNQCLQFPGNSDLGINTLSWAAEEENKISIHPKEDESRMITLTTVSANVMFYLAVILIPLGTLITGGIVWYRRRSL